MFIFVLSKKKTAMSLELILEQIELKENTLNDNTFDVFYDFNKKLFYAFENDVEGGQIREFVFKLKDTEENIISKHRDEILNYCLAVVLPTDTVGLGDIFLHSGFIERVEVDLFDTPELWSPELYEVITKFSEMDETYRNCENLVNELETIGYTCDYYLDAIPHNLRKL
jgi:hypothetical protein